MAPEPYPYVFYNARWSGYFMLLLGFGFLAAAIFGLASQRFVELAGLFFLLLAGLAIWIGWKAVTDTKPALQFGRNGVWTRKLGAMPWQQVILTYRTVSNPKSGSIESLIILDKATRQQLDWVPLTAINGSTTRIKQSLASCKKAQFL